MIKVVDGYSLLTLVYGSAKSTGELMHPYANIKGEHTGKYMYSISDGTIYNPIDLKDLIKLLLDGKFDSKGTIRMKSAQNPREHGNPGCSPKFDKAKLKDFYLSL